MEYAEIEKLFKGLRVSDVRDGLDCIGLFSKGSVSRSITPLFAGAKVAGPALTVRLVASHMQAPPMRPEEYTAWAHDFWYKERHIEPYYEEIKTGDVIVIEGLDLGVGSIGSANTLSFFLKGAQGLVTSGGVRDVDECRVQKVPIFAQFINQAMTQGRIEYEAHNVPITVGGVRVDPGDIVVGDGDGVIVVPADRAVEVAKYAREVAIADRELRRRMYERAGWEPDETTKPLD